MSEAQSEADRPHEATPKRIADALKRGDTPASREPALVGSLAAFAALATMGGERLGVELGGSLVSLWRRAGGQTLPDADAAVALLRDVMLAAGTALVAPLALLAAGALLPAILQRPRVASKRIAPKGSNLSPAKGIKRLFGPAGLFEFGKATFKIVAIGCACAWAIRSGVVESTALIHSADVAVAHRLHDRSQALALLVAALALPIALADLLWSRHRWRQRMRMTDEEFRRENKDSDGDPAVRARRQSLRRDRARRGMIGRVAEADLVVVNPTHVAVALAYDRARHAAPVVVAKGRGHVALRIRERAETAGVPLFREPPLARALERSVPLDTAIPEEFYALVAALIRQLDGDGPREPAG